MKLHVIILFALILASCGTSRLSSDAGITPLVSSKQIAIEQRDAHLFLIGANSFAALGRDDSLRYIVSRYDTSLRIAWRAILPIAERDQIDIAGVHAHEGAIHIPAAHLTDEGVSQYVLHTLDLATGVEREAVPLLRINVHDIASLEQGFNDHAESKTRAKVVSVWSPDSSKILLHKVYPVGNDRITIEMRLFKKGYSLITRNNVDFRFDRSKQELLGILPDNDGVAYIFLRNKQDSSFEVGRFEILGSMRLKTIKYKATGDNNYPTQGKIAVAPRGHAYLATLGDAKVGHPFSLIDFDFYQSTTVLDTQRLERDGGGKGMSRELTGLVVAPNLDRIVLQIDEHGSATSTKTQFHVYDLSARPVWSMTLDANAGTTTDRYNRIEQGGLDLLFTSGDTLQNYLIPLPEIRPSQTRVLAKLPSSLRVKLSDAIRIGDAFYLALGHKLYRLGEHAPQIIR